MIFLLLRRSIGVTMIIRIALFLSVFLLIQSNAFGNELVDPLRGLSLERTFKESNRVLLVQITSASRGSADFCRYDYSATVLRLYKLTDKTYSVQSQVEFSSSDPLRIDDKILIIKNHESDNLNPKAQAACRVQIKNRLGKNALLVRNNEIVHVYGNDAKLYAFLPFRHFWSLHAAVTTRETKIPNDGARYALLRIADGCLDGQFYDLDELVK